MSGIGFCITIAVLRSCVQDVAASSGIYEKPLHTCGLNNSNNNNIYNYVLIKFLPHGGERANETV